MRNLLPNFKKHMEREPGLRKIFASLSSPLILLYKTF